MLRHNTFLIVFMLCLSLGIISNIPPPIQARTWTTIDDHSGWFTLRNASVSSGFTYTIEGGNVVCLAARSDYADYRWGYTEDQTRWAYTEWTDNEYGRNHTFTFTSDGTYTIQYCVRITSTYFNKTSCTEQSIEIEDIQYSGDTNPSNHTSAERCRDAGFHWWNNHCWNYSEPLPWENLPGYDKPLPEAGTHDALKDLPNIITENLNTNTVLFLILIVLVILVYYWKREK